MAKVLSKTQQDVIDFIKENDYSIEHFRGIGTRYKSSASIQNSNGRQVKTISVATFKALRGMGLFAPPTETGLYHKNYKLKPA